MLDHVDTENEGRHVTSIGFHDTVSNALCTLYIIDSWNSQSDSLSSSHKS